MAEQVKTHWKKMFNYDYLGSYSFNDGETKVLTIANIKKEMVTGTGGKKEQCTICTFRESEKPMILNRTNCKAITKAYNTPHVEDWIGKRISIFVQQGIKVGTETTDGLRIKDQIPGNEITSAQLKDLLLFKITALTEKEVENAQKVIDTNDASRFSALLEFLNSK